MIKDTVSNASEEKFFFDQNVFDEEDVNDAEIEEEEPPPPVFSEEELEAAKKSAFQKGHAQATLEEKNSREQHLATLLQTLTKDMSTLFAQEQAREKLYEDEVVALTHSIFQKLFPVYAAEHSFDELKNALGSVLQSHAQKQEVIVRVNPDFSEGVEAFLQDLKQTDPHIRVSVQSDDTLVGAACALSWKDGGALHDNAAMADEILGILQDGLAAQPSTGHDSEETGQMNEAEPPEAISEPQTPETSSDNPDLEEKPDE